MKTGDNAKITSTIQSGSGINNAANGIVVNGATGSSISINKSDETADRKKQAAELCEAIQRSLAQKDYATASDLLAKAIQLQPNDPVIQDLKKQVADLKFRQSLESVDILLQSSGSENLIYANSQIRELQMEYPGNEQLAAKSTVVDAEMESYKGFIAFATKVALAEHLNFNARYGGLTKADAETWMAELKNSKHAPATIAAMKQALAQTGQLYSNSTMIKEIQNTLDDLPAKK